MRKRCAWGTCNSDNKYADQPHMDGVTFIPFPKPKTNPGRCKEWITLCNRPHEQLNFNNIRSHHFVCSKHFSGGRQDPDPAGQAAPLKRRKAPALRTAPPPKKTRNAKGSEDSSTSSVVMNGSTETAYTVMPSAASAACSDAVSPALGLSSFDCSRTDLPNFSCLFDSPTKTTEATTVQPVNEPPIFVGQEIENNVPKTTPERLPIPVLEELCYKSPKKVHNPLKYEIYCKNCNITMEIDDKESRALIRTRFLNKVLSTDSDCFFFTGIPTVEFLYSLFGWVSKSIDNLQLAANRDSSKRWTVHYKGQFILTLVKIRRGFDNRHLAFLFGISSSSVSRIFHLWVKFLDHCFSQCIRWPSKETCQSNLPPDFESFPRTRAIIDCTEYYIERPFMPHAQKLTYSNYKQRNTLKQLIAISPTGAITFVSKLYAGSISDQAIVNCSNFLDKIEKDDDVMANRGFNIRHMLLKKGATLNIPAFSRGQNLGVKAVQRSRKIASVRIHVERAILRMKTFRILRGPISLKLRFSLNAVTRIIAVLCNFQGRLCG